jgi:hypothetical protein
MVRQITLTSSNFNTVLDCFLAKTPDFKGEFTFFIRIIVSYCIYWYLSGVMMRRIKPHIFLFALLFAGYFAQAAPPPPPGGGSSPPCWPPPCMPVDGGVGFLLAAAAVYGGKKLYDFQRKS